MKTSSLTDAAPAKTRILVVDDDAMLRFLAAETIASDEFDVIQAEDGAHAIEAFVDHRPDLVLLDVMMPDMTGYAVCERLRALPGGASTPIVMMTGLDDPESIDRAYAVGATDFTTKPINYPLLTHRVRYLLRASVAFTEAQKTAAELAHAQKLARLTRWELDVATGAFRWSPSAEAILGVPVDGTNLEDALLRFVSLADRERVEGSIRAIGQDPNGARDVDYRIIGLDGRDLHVHQEVELVQSSVDERQLVLGVVQDVSALRQAERRIHDLAFFDTLTMLPNRAYLLRFLARALAAHAESSAGEGRVVAVLALDLDGFKRVNDTLGHSGGDQLLREVGRRLVGCVRSTSDVVPWPDPEGPAALSQDMVAARVGGDEFVIVLTGLAEADHARLIAERISERVSNRYQIGGADAFVSTSVGIAVASSDDATVEDVLHRADVAMYHAKKTGRNCIRFYAASMAEQAHARLTLENRLRAALARDGIHGAGGGVSARPEFHLHYQPKVEVPSGRVVGVEALLRWTMPDGRPCSPAEFIPVAEETGLIVPLGEWVLRTACLQARDWALGGDGLGALRVAVNVSARQFRDPELPAMVARILRETGVTPQLIELEITEGMVMEDTSAGKTMLDDLKRLGVRLSLDDFGTGYSSLSYLTRLPIDALKIDRSFIREIGSSARGDVIATAIIALSRSLDIDVVVEGVENVEQLSFVNRQGSAEVQGFFFAKPMPPGELRAWCISHASKHRQPHAA